ncbi:hypothetical protein [Sphingomonas qomolangmaensis]|uniref:Bacterial CdiA-CT RNAse A domain-containing protein n=1 Tax=Sphingomonas qomolangmaensis TaxID=2918765 RepID=A0ABY5L5D4_9SPHN|nr:hypothetical protein [Sphingomonas qomolangmaensis]UUL81278.1 hypothetical protein NMP03_08530 [Sphingomonas qomolangmaensis]
MIDINGPDQRRTISVWLRTGRLPAFPTDGIELKFNPYHDPRNGQFTFAPGGPRSLSRVIISHRRSRAFAADNAGAARSPELPIDPPRKPQTTSLQPIVVSDAVYRPGDTDPDLQQISSRPPRAGRGSNSRAFEDPMLLEQTFPGLRNAPGGAMLSVADHIFDLTGPARATTAALTQARTRVLIEQIGAIDPNYRFQSLGVPQTLQGQVNQVDGLRFDRAAAFVRTKGELRPMQVETLRFMQQRADLAYARGVKLLNARLLPIRLSSQEALGNYIDREVRKDLRRRYAQAGIDSGGAGPIRVNRRENDSSGSDATFRRPDARVGAVAYDVTLTRKTIQTGQVRGFFATDFQPTQVIIVRPRQLGPDNSYIITRPEAKR